MSDTDRRDYIQLLFHFFKLLSVSMCQFRVYMCVDLIVKCYLSNKKDRNVTIGSPLDKTSRAMSHIK